MIIRKNIDFNEPLTEEQRDMLKALETRPVQPDEECPELTSEQLSQLARVSEQRRAERRKQTITLRLSPQAAQAAKALGKGYTSVLSRILESALNDADFIKNYL